MIFQLVDVNGEEVFQGPLWYLRSCLREEQGVFFSIGIRLEEDSWEGREDVWALVCSDQKSGDEFFSLEPEMTRQFLCSLGAKYSPTTRPYLCPEDRVGLIPPYKV